MRLTLRQCKLFARAAASQQRKQDRNRLMLLRAAQAENEDYRKILSALSEP